MPPENLIMYNQDIKDSYDVAIVGARCAGSATAMLLARMGARVLVIDQAPARSDTLSTHALMRGAVMQLRNWGLLSRIAASGAPPIRTTSFIYGDQEPIDIELRSSHGSDALYAPRRMVLDTVIASAAAESGATVRYGVKCQDLVRGSDGFVCGAILRDASGQVKTVKSELVIGADGRQSTVARLVGAMKIKEATNASQCVYGYFSGLSGTGYRWHYGDEAAGGIIPTNDGQSCVFLSMSNQRGPGFAKLSKIEQFREYIANSMPQLAQDIRAGSLDGRLVGFGGARGFLRKSCGDGWALVGDAGYFKDPITAHGITDALRDAQILAQSWSDCRLDDYVATRDALSRDLMRVTDAIAGFNSTTPELMQLHQNLNTAMKANQEWIAGNLTQLAEAA